jgi:hydrogenase expression/formation protein HypC
MCLAIPGQIKAVNGTEAEIDVAGVRRTISVMLTPEVQVDDYVYVHTGFSISIVDEAEALESLRLLRELAETYPVDELYMTTGDLPRGG